MEGKIMSNVNKVKKPAVTIDLDKERHLKYTLNAFAEMEDRYGSVDAALEVVKNNNMRAIIFIIWCGLTHEDEDLTEKQVGNMIEIDQLQDIVGKLNEAIGGDLPTPAASNTKVVKVGENPNA
jgi:hypothetical protein